MKMFTFLRSNEPFSQNDLILAGQRTGSPSFLWDKDPKVLLIFGEFTQEQIKEIFPDRDFEHQIYEGYDRLPIPFTEKIFQGHLAQLQHHP